MIPRLHSPEVQENCHIVQSFIYCGPFLNNGGIGGGKGLKLIWIES